MRGNISVMTGLVSIELVCKYYSIDIDVESLKRKYFIAEELSAEEILRILKDIGFKTGHKNFRTLQELKKYPFPGIVILKDNSFAVVDEEGKDALVFNTDKERVVLFKDGDDLIVGYSENDFVRVVNQFKEEDYQGIERIQVKDGHYITRWDIENIVNAIIDFNSDKGMDYTQKYNELINNQQYMALLSGSWHNTSLFSIA